MPKKKILLLTTGAVSYTHLYSDAKYFAKLFKKKMGSTPSEYRNLIIQGGIDGN